jgi:hypothetical protein
MMAETDEITEIDTEKLMDDLNLDDTPENKAIITDLILDASDLIRSSVNYKVPETEYFKFPIYIRAVKTLATQLYYDRELSEGMSKGLQMMINHLKGRVVDGS